jgi:hypothetical protein
MLRLFKNQASQQSDEDDEHENEAVARMNIGDYFSKFSPLSA